MSTQRYIKYWYKTRYLNVHGSKIYLVTSFMILIISIIYKVKNCFKICIQYM